LGKLKTKMIFTLLRADTCPQNPGFMNRKLKSIISLKKFVTQNLFLKNTIPSTLLQISFKSCLDRHLVSLHCRPTSESEHNIHQMYFLH